MAYRVRITDRAASDAVEAHNWILNESPERALKWLDGLSDAIGSLAEFPARCPVAPESGALPVQVRQLLYGRRGGVYRILFQIQEEPKVVTILRVRHGSRLPLDDHSLLEPD